MKMFRYPPARKFLSICAVLAVAFGVAFVTLYYYSNRAAVSGSAPTVDGSLISVTYDTGYQNGVNFNSILWQGTLGSGSSSVSFQFASSNCPNGASNYPTCTSGASNITGLINSVNYWAWNDTLGWLNFSQATVGTTNLTKWATVQSSGDYIALDCATLPPNGSNNCSGDGYFTVSDNSNALAGFAWNDTYGWISFCGDSSGHTSTWNGSSWVCPASPTYEVEIDGSGNFYGWAWNDILGWISFNCDQTEAGGSNTCGTSSYKVQVNGSNNAWNFTGPDGTSNSYYTAGPGVSMPLVGQANARYYRYEVFLNKSAGATSPTVNNIVVNWSP